MMVSYPISIIITTFVAALLPIIIMTRHKYADPGRRDLKGPKPFRTKNPKAKCWIRGAAKEEWLHKRPKSKIRNPKFRAVGASHEELLHSRPNSKIQLNILDFGLEFWILEGGDDVPKTTNSYIIRTTIRLWALPNPAPCTNRDGFPELRQCPTCFILIGSCQKDHMILQLDSIQTHKNNIELQNRYCQVFCLGVTHRNQLLHSAWLQEKIDWFASKLLHHIAQANRCKLSFSAHTTQAHCVRELVKPRLGSLISKLIHVFFGEQKENTKRKQQNRK